MFGKLIAVLLITLPSLGHAATIDPDARVVTLAQSQDWTRFRFSEDLRGGAWLEGDVDVDNGDGTGIQPSELRPVVFMVSLQERALLQVTDAFLYGDMFNVFINDRSESTTAVSKPGPNLSQTLLTGDPEYDIGADFDAAFSDPKWSSGSWLLDPGEYQVFGSANASVLRGTGALRVASAQSLTPVSAPNALILLSSVIGILASLAALLRRIR